MVRRTVRIERLFRRLEHWRQITTRNDLSGLALIAVTTQCSK